MTRLEQFAEALTNEIRCALNSHWTKTSAVDVAVARLRQFAVEVSTVRNPSNDIDPYLDERVCIHGTAGYCAACHEGMYP